jgi:hypothetical protein
MKRGNNGAEGRRMRPDCMASRAMFNTPPGADVHRVSKVIHKLREEKEKIRSVSETMGIFAPLLILPLLRQAERSNEGEVGVAGKNLGE